MNRAVSKVTNPEKGFSDGKWQKQQSKFESDENEMIEEWRASLVDF